MLKAFAACIVGIVCVLFATTAATAVAGENEPIATDLHETIVQVPMTVHTLYGDMPRELVATTYTPDGAGPFPLIVLSHGNPVSPHDRAKIGRFRAIAQIRTFVERGFAVIVPIRRGFGATGGEFAEEAYSCRTPDYDHAASEAARDLLATISYADTLPFVDPKRVVLVGQSAGGFASLAAASMAPPGVVGVVNFSGGRGGGPATHPGMPCGPDIMAATLARFGATTTVPVLWHYVENDQFFGPDVVRAWFSAYQGAGAKAQLVMEPPFGHNGHGMFAVDAAIPIWLPHVDTFLAPFERRDATALNERVSAAFAVAH